MAPRKKYFRIPRHRKKEKTFKLVEEDSDNDGDEEEIFEIDGNENRSPQLQPIVIYPPPQPPLPQPAASVIQNQPIPRPSPPPPPLQPNQPPIRTPSPITIPSPVTIQQPIKIQTPAPRIIPKPAPPIPNPSQLPQQPLPPIQPMILPIPQPFSGMFPLPWYPQQQYPPYPAYPPFQPPYYYPGTKRPPKPKTTKSKNLPKPRRTKATAPPIGSGAMETTVAATTLNVGEGVIIPRRINPVPLVGPQPRNKPRGRPQPPVPQQPPPRIPSSFTSTTENLGDGIEIQNSTTQATSNTFPTSTTEILGDGVVIQNITDTTPNTFPTSTTEILGRGVEILNVTTTPNTFPTTTTPEIGNGVELLSSPQTTTPNNYFPVTVSPVEPQKSSAENSDTDCCISLTAGWLTVGIFMFLSILIVLACLYCICYFRKKEKRKCKNAIKQYNENYHQNSKLPNFDSHYMPPGSAIMTPQAKMDLMMKNMKDNPHPITTDEKSIAAVLNYLADNPIEHDVIYRPGRQDIVLSQKEIPPHLKSIPSSEIGCEAVGLKLPESSQFDGRETNNKNAPKTAAVEKNEKEKSKKNENSWSKKGSKSIKKIKEKLFNRSKSDKKGKPSSMPKKEKEKIEEAPKIDAQSPNPRRSKDRVVFHEGKHHRL